MLFVPLYQYTLSLSKHLFVSQPVPFHIPCFERFVFIPKFTNPSVIELSILRGVAGFLCSNMIKSGFMPISVFLLLKIPHVSTSAAETTTLRIVLHSLCMGSFLLGLCFIGIGEGQSLR